MDHALARGRRSADGAVAVVDEDVDPVGPVHLVVCEHRMSLPRQQAAVLQRHEHRAMLLELCADLLQLVAQRVLADPTVHASLA